METVGLFLLGAVAMWWFFGGQQHEDRKASRVADRRWTAQCEQSKLRKAAFIWEAEQCSSAVALSASPPSELRDLVSDFDLIAQGIAPGSLVNVLEPRLTLPATAQGGRQVVIRYYEAQDVEAALEHDVHALSVNWAEGVMQRYVAMRRAEKEQIAREVIQHHAELAAKSNEVRRRVEAAKAKLSGSSE